MKKNHSLNNTIIGYFAAIAPIKKTMFCKSVRLMSLSCIAVVVFSHLGTTKTIPWNQLGTQAVEQSGNRGLAVTEQWNGYRLECQMQAIMAEVTMSDMTIQSTSKSEGKGVLSIRPSRLGRIGSMRFRLVIDG
jgi:hypothetical protein